MLENHGVVIGGRDLAEAFQRFETLEFVAQTVIRASALGELRRLEAGSLSAGEAVPDFAELPAAVATNLEKALRGEVCAFAQRAYRQRLMISTAGAISARLNETEFVITPRRRDRLDLKPASLVRATARAAEVGKRASRTSRLSSWSAWPRTRASSAALARSPKFHCGPSRSAWPSPRSPRRSPPRALS
jgi:L-fuculose-phosphate aldolase